MNKNTMYIVYYDDNIIDYISCNNKRIAKKIANNRMVIGNYTK